MSGGRICFLGNSHMACVSRALEESAVLPVGSYDVFTSIGGGQPKVILEDGKLLPAHDRAREGFRISAHGRHEIVLSDYDAFIVVAAGLHAVREQFLHPFKDVVLSRVAGEVHEPKDVGDRTYVSRGCAYALIKGSLSRRGAVCAIRDIAAHVRAPIVVAPCPLPSRSYFDRAGNIFSKLHGPAGAAQWAEWSRLHRAALAEAMSTLGSNVRLLSHPAEAIDGAGYSTKADFETDDPWHMNAAYGALVLDAAMAALAKNET